MLAGNTGHLFCLLGDGAIAFFATQRTRARESFTFARSVSIPSLRTVPTVGHKSIADPRRSCRVESRVRQHDQSLVARQWHCFSPSQHFIVPCIRAWIHKRMIRK